jgi:VanZ family protein
MRDSFNAMNSCRALPLNTDRVGAMNPFFSVLSAFYIFGIFYWADSPAVAQIGAFNPYSLLHIPLYGILTILLILALRPGAGIAGRNRRVGAGLIALAVGILDEYHQTFIPTRTGDPVDVLLDVLGIGLAMGLGPHFVVRPIDWLWAKIRIRELW